MEKRKVWIKIVQELGTWLLLPLLTIAVLYFILRWTVLWLAKPFTHEPESILDEDVRKG